MSELQLEELGQAFRAIRERVGLTQEEAAIEADTTQSTISRMEQGQFGALTTAMRVATVIVGEAQKLRGAPMHDLLSQDGVLRVVALAEAAADFLPILAQVPGKTTQVA